MRTPRLSGFTIIELMIVLVIAGVMATLAAPSLGDLVVRMRLKTAAADLHSSFVLARSEAIKRNAGVQVVANNSANWALGWSVIEPAGGSVLSRQDPYANVSFRTTNAAYATVTPLANVTFSGTGRETGSAGAGVAVVISSSQYPTIHARCVVLDPSGRAAVRQDRDFDASNGCN
jgi:type IV fimbrial biogenesis protein FimT